MQIHARFKLYEDARASVYAKGQYRDGARVKLGAVQSGDFFTATPQGSIEMLIADPVARDFFHDVPLGQEFDVIFTPIEAEKAST